MRPSHSRRAQTALSHMAEVDPAVAALALWCAHRDHDDPTCTQGDTILYGPEFEALSVPEQIGLAAHHVLHVALRHSARQTEMASRLGRKFKPLLYNLASDAIVNEALLNGNHALPRPAVRAKELIELLPGLDTVAPDILGDWDTDRLYHALARPRDGDPSETNPAIEDYLLKRRFAPDLTAEGTYESQSDVWSSRVDQALDMGRSGGIGIGVSLARFADLPQSRTPWELRLRRLLLKAASDVPRVSHRRPSSRWIASDAQARQSGTRTPAFEPGMTRDIRRPRLAIALDTSSSVTDRQLDLFASEAVGIQRRTTAELHLLAFDTEVHTHQRFDHADDLTRIDMRRGGGTSFDPVIAKAGQLDPSLLIVLTDLEAPLGPQPGFPVIWAVPSAVTRAPSFGTVLSMQH
ncbi:vWA domain-containing protein [Marivita hallyeonensis]|uniref:Predicted metal-dependent peptidase n=1 Tax=Marivita hallyeonensis TaxID=996342 RepID=A0A1M5VJU1_9RHOB|nr:VWA-like domain-containing protein [Marivita hallyeonensis]SHH75501.1 Predicted metal-dependent peptidase [Marivita hallyeonensis]